MFRFIQYTNTPEKINTAAAGAESILGAAAVFKIPNGSPTRPEGSRMRITVDMSVDY